MGQVVELAKHREARCPNCGSENKVPIFWGPTSRRAVERYKRGEIMLSSCQPRDHKWHCRDCQASWGPRTRRPRRR